MSYSYDEQPEYCTICGERMGSGEEWAEFHHPVEWAKHQAKGGRYQDFNARWNGLVHAQCGFDHGWETS